MKKELAIIWNDVHLKPGNEEEILTAVRFMIKKCKELNIKRTIFAGDLFDSRSFQRQRVLKTFDTILIELNNAGIHTDLIPGNHDKTIYASYDSFLEPYRHFPNVSYYKEITDVEIEGVKLTYLPFFSDSMLIPMLNKHNGSDVLISHFEMQGSTHLGSTSEKTSINKKLLSKWKKTYLGHYHNTHEISKNIVHLPSFIQANFGEDNNKGFTILYDDLSYEIIKGCFKEFRKIEININNVLLSEIKELIKTYKNTSDTVRFEFTGEESKLKALDKSLFKDTGIDVKIKYGSKYNYDNKDSKIPILVEKYDKTFVKKSFKEFCENKGYDYNKGREILNEFLKQK